MSPQPQLTAGDALARLREGNQRFASNVRSVEAMASHTRRGEHVSFQQPFAVVLGCSDSRAPSEILFDQGLGDLFVIRVAGSIVAPSQVGSVEFAVEAFKTRLVVVLGHTGCGAIKATLDHLEQRKAGGGSRPTPGLLSIVERVRPSIEPLLGTELAKDRAALSRASVRANVKASVLHLRTGSRLLEEEVLHGGLQVVGGEYNLETGVVDFFELQDT